MLRNQSLALFVCFTLVSCTDCPDHDDDGECDLVCNDDPLMTSGDLEYCDGMDNDCDGLLDEDDAVDVVPWYADVDGDGYGDEEEVVFACQQPAGHVHVYGDCDDRDPDAHPLNPENCPGTDTQALFR